MLGLSKRLDTTSAASLSPSLNMLEVRDAMRCDQWNKCCDELNKCDECDALEQEAMRWSRVGPARNPGDGRSEGVNCSESGDDRDKSGDC